MRQTVILSLSLIVLVISISVKIVRSDQTSGTLDHSRMTDQLSRFLQDDGFVALGPAPFDDYQVVLAYRGGCRLKATIVPEEGFASQAVQGLAEAGDTVEFAFDGALYPKHPLVSSLVTKYVDRLSRGLGLIDYVRPVIAIVASDACKPAELPWAKMARLPFDQAETNERAE